MFDEWRRVISAEIALQKHNKVNRLGRVSDRAQGYHVIENALPENVFEGLVDASQTLYRRSIRENSHWRKGQAIGGHELADSIAQPWLAYFTTPEFIQRLRNETDIATLDLVPAVDTNRISLLYYDAPKDGDAFGDGTDWHMDGSIYLGARWAGILTLIEDTQDDTSKLELQPFGKLAQLPTTNLTNSLVLFQGDHVMHRVRALAPGERRVVISLLLSDWPVRTRNPWLRRYQSKVNLAFYGNSNP